MFTCNNRNMRLSYGATESQHQWAIKRASSIRRLVAFRGKTKKLLSNNNIKCGKLFVGYSTINWITHYARFTPQAWAAREQRVFFSAPMLTNECIHTGSRSSAWTLSRSVAWAALQRSFRRPVYFCCAAHAQIKWQHTFDGQNKYDFTQKLL